MDAQILKIIKNLEIDTKAGNQIWERLDNTDCIFTSYRNDRILMCRYTFNNNTQVVSFNFLDEDNRIKNRDINKVKSGEAAFDDLINLYQIALNSSQSLHIAY